MFWTGSASGLRRDRSPRSRGEFCREARFVVLDEPTSSTDSRAEHDFYNAFRDIVQGRTALLISHRMATVRIADSIYVLADGRIAENGRHDSLMAADGLHAEPFRRRALERGVPRSFAPEAIDVVEQPTEPLQAYPVSLEEIRVDLDAEWAAR